MYFGVLLNMKISLQMLNLSMLDFPQAIPNLSFFPENWVVFML
jgi:hypothetical protein